MKGRTAAPAPAKNFVLSGLPDQSVICAPESPQVEPCS